MDKLLRPEKLETEPNSSNAAQHWKHWYRSFKNFLDAAKATEAQNRLNLLVNYVSPSIYVYISESLTYDDAIGVLESLYIKPKNEVLFLLGIPYQKDDKKLENL